LIKSCKTNKGLSARRVNQLLKVLTAQAAIPFAATQPEKAERLQRFSAHWLRHLFCSMQGRAEIKKLHIKQNAGHRSEQTTELYLHAFDNERHEEMEKLDWLVPNAVLSQTA
jgi:integrase